MKNLIAVFVAVLILLLLPISAAAQRVQKISISQTQDMVTADFGNITAAGTYWFPTQPFGSTLHTLTFTYTTQPSAITVALACSKDVGSTVSVTIGTSTSTTGATIQGGGNCNSIAVVVSGLTGSLSIRPVYRGSDPVSSGASGNGTPPIYCGQSVSVDITSAGTTQIIAAVPGQTIYICGYGITAGGSAGSSGMVDSLTSSAGAGCSSGTARVGPNFAYGSTFVTFSAGSGMGMMYKTRAGAALCMVQTNAVQTSAAVTYSQFGFGGGSGDPLNDFLMIIPEILVLVNLRRRRIRYF